MYGKDYFNKRQKALAAAGRIQWREVFINSLIILVVVFVVGSLVVSLAPKALPTAVRFRVDGIWHTGQADHNTKVYSYEVIGFCDDEQCYPLWRVEMYKYE